MPSEDVQQTPQLQPADAANQRRSAPAVGRNRDAILAVLGRALRAMVDAKGANRAPRTVPHTCRVLEIASGTGEHAIHFAAALPWVFWQPSDPDADALQSIAAWRADAQLANVAAPVLLDVRKRPWPSSVEADALVCINMVHIAPWEAAESLFAGAETLLAASGVLYLYGPYRRNGAHTAPSNAAFDAQLRERDNRWGIRNLEDMVQLGGRHGFTLSETIDMPANNLSLIFHRG